MLSATKYTVFIWLLIFVTGGSKLCHVKVTFPVVSQSNGEKKKRKVLFQKLCSEAAKPSGGALLIEMCSPEI